MHELDISPKMEHTDDCIYTRYFFIIQNIKVTELHSNTYTNNIILISMGGKNYGLRRKEFRNTIYFTEHP